MSACTGTIVSTDHRGDPRRPVWEKTVTYVCVTADTTATVPVPIEGILQKIIFTRPDLANNDLTSTLTIGDRGNKTMFTSAAGLVENVTSVWDVSEPLSGPCDVLITFNEAVGSAGTFTVVLRGI